MAGTNKNQISLTISLLLFVLIAVSKNSLVAAFDSSEIHLLETAQNRRSERGKIMDPLIRFGKRSTLSESDIPIRTIDNQKMESVNDFDGTNEKRNADSSMNRQSRGGDSAFDTMNPLIRFGKRRPSDADMMIRFGRGPRPRRPDADTMLRFGRGSDLAASSDQHHN